MLERWVVQTIMNTLKNGVDEYVCFVGMRPDPNTQAYYSLQVVGTAPARVRRGSVDKNFLINIGCHARVDEVEENRNIMKPWKLAEAAKTLFEHVDLEIKSLPDQTLLGCLNVHEAAMEHLDPSNLVFGGEGDFAIDDRLFHTVVVSLTASLVQ